MSYIEKFWRPATDKDVARVMNGETVEARFSDLPNSVWSKVYQLRGAKRLNDTETLWLSPSASWRYCQVYAPPQWFLDKPDPGEEYRLLGKEPDEAKHRDDEIFREGRWDSVGFDDGKQREGFWYRRKIDPKPEPKFAVGQRVKIVGPPIKGEGPIYNWTKEMDQYIGVVGAVRLKPTQDPEGAFYVVEEVFQWSFREDYLEPVEPKHYVLQVGDTVEFPGGVVLKASLERGIHTKND